MVATDKRVERAVKALRLLPAKSRKSALDFIEFLAQENDIDLLLEVEDVAEDLQAAKRFRGGDRSGTVTLAEARKRLAASRQ